MAKLSELEGAVLGVVWADGPCTAYAVRRTFKDSLSPQWSGSAGAIYPLLDRLRQRGLLRSKRRPGDRRGGRLWRPTAAGLRALRQWLAPPLPDWVIGVPVDALRTRLQFLGALSPARRAAFLQDARTGLQDHIVEVEKDCRTSRGGPDPYHHLVARGALAMVRARRAWLKEVARALGRSGRLGPSSRA
jgi:DNA-binding PadR family transcriptional regulator